MTKTRGFEIVKKYENAGINLPRRMTKNAAGYDFEAAETAEILPGEVKFISTGVKAFMKNDEVLFLHDRSSNPQKLGVVLINSVGVLDADYYDNPDNEGEIFAIFQNIRTEKITIKKGTRMIQGVFMKYLLADNDENFAKTSRVGGLGSTNKKRG